MSSSKKCIRLKRIYDTNISKNDHENAAIAAVNLAQQFNEDDDHEKSYEYYEDAKFCAAKISKKSDKLLYNEFLAYRCSHEQCCKIYQSDEQKIKKSLHTFLEYAEQRKDVSYKQIALHIVAYTYQMYLKGEDNYLETAKCYALDSLKCLDTASDKIDKVLQKRKHEFEADSGRRRAGIYQLLASIIDEAGDANAAEEYCNKAMTFERLEEDPLFHHTVLSTQRNLVPRKRKLEISKTMLEVLNKMDVKDHDQQILETLFNAAEDSLARKDLAEADKFFWKIYSSEINDDGDGRSWKNDAKKCLIKSYRIKKRVEEVTELERNELLEYRELAKMYEKIGDSSFDATAYELAVEYYSKMKDAAALVPGDPEYGDLELSRGAITSLAEAFSDELNDFEKALGYFERLYKIEIRLSCLPAELAETRLNIAMVKKECERYTYEEKKDAFEKVKMPKDNVILYVKYLEHYIYFLKKHKNKAGVSSLINDLSLEFSKYKQLQNASQTSIDTTIRQSSQDKFDRLSDNEIFEQVKKHFEMEEDIEKKRKVMRKPDPNYGEIPLHKAARESLEEVQYLIEKCGYDAVIDAKDNGNWTPLSEAVSYRYADIVEYLISKGADVNTQSTEALIGEDGEECSGARQTPLMVACSSGFYEIICMLIRNKADACKRNENGWTAGDYLERFMTQLDEKERDQFEEILKWLREEEAKGGILNHKKKALDLPKMALKKLVPIMPKVCTHAKPGVPLYQEVMASVGRRTSLRSFANSKEKGIKDDVDEEMVEDDDEFIAPEFDEDLNGIDEEEDAMDVDDYNFRQYNGFASSTPTRIKTLTKKRRSNRAKSDVMDDERDVENNVEDDIFMLPQEITPQNGIIERNRNSETLLKRRSANRSFDSSSSSKKTKRSTSLTNSNLSKTSSSVNTSITEAVDSLSLMLPQYLTTRINIDAKELDLSFSENIVEVTTKLKLYLNLYSLCLKGSDFDDDIDELVDAICSCHKLVELDLSQVEQIQSNHANKILKSCSKLKVLDLYGTSINALNLQKEYILEKLIIAKTPFEYSDVFYQQINELPTLSCLDVSHTSIDLVSLLSKLTSTRTKLFQIKACPVTSYLDLYQFTQTIAKMDQQNVKLKLPRSTKEEFLRINSAASSFLE